MLNGDINDKPRQHDMVRVVRQGSTLERIVNAVTEPSPHGDELLVTVANGGTNDILDQIRELVAR
jgi:hypothetical protein